MKSILFPHCIPGALFILATVVFVFNASARPNLALFHPIAGSSTGEDNPPAKAVNGILTDRWESQTDDSEWIYVDLGVVYSVDSVLVRWETAAGLDYAIQTANTPSDNDNGWTTVAHITDGAQGETRSITFAPASTRYVRLRGYKRASIFAYSIWEFEVYGNAATCIPPVIATSPADRTFVDSLTTSFNVYADGTGMSYQWQHMRLMDNTYFSIPLAVNAYYSFKPIISDSAALFRCIISSSCGIDTTSSASLSLSKKAKINLACKKPGKCTSFEGTDMTAASAFDDDSATRWGTNYKTDPNKDSAWIYVDLGTVCTIDSVFLNWEDSGAKEYLLQIANTPSDNDAGWTTVAHITDGAGWQKRPIKIAQTLARFVRVRCLQRLSGFGYSIIEFEVYGPSSTGAVIDKADKGARRGSLVSIRKFPGRCVISEAGGTVGALRADLFSQDGRLVRSLWGFSGALVWDYADRFGKRVNNGVYLLKAVSAGKTAHEAIAVCR
jgi:F5/8 type C domain